MIDLHCHVLPGIDDGPPTLAESFAMARAHVAAGTRIVVATPHVSWGHPHVTAELIAERVADLNVALEEEGIDLAVVAGAEIALSRAGDLTDDELRALALGDGPWLLVEPPFSPGFSGIDGVLNSLLLRGHKLLLAHPERSPSLASEPSRLQPFVEAGMLCQITAGSLSGQFGRTVQKAARQMLVEELGHCVASDAHDTVRRPPGMVTEIDEAGFGDLTAWLTSGVPGAVIAGTPIPGRPEGFPEPKHGLTRLLRRKRQ